MVLIVGAGLSGLYFASELEKRGIAYQIIEAKSTIGGRIQTKYHNGLALELGATWIQQEHTQLIHLAKSLGISLFPQELGNRYIFEPKDAAPQIYGMPPSNKSYRVKDGTYSIIKALYDKLNPQNVYLNESLKGIKQLEDEQTLRVQTSKRVIDATHVYITLPPKLMIDQISFEPALSQEFRQVAQETQTWMEEAIRAAVYFEEPLWLKQNVPSTLFSQQGPFVELYDHSNAEQSRYALGGFLNPELHTLSKEERKAKVLAQMKSLFSISKEEELHYEEKVWREDPFTANYTSFLMPHQEHGNPIFQSEFYEGRLLLGATETAPEYGGYMEGAVRAAQNTLLKLEAFFN